VDNVSFVSSKGAMGASEFATIMWKSRLQRQKIWAVTQNKEQTGRHNSGVESFGTCLAGETSNRLLERPVL